jgi:chemotaxis protein MotB
MGVPAARMVAIGYADNRPLDVNTTPEGRTRNRRVNVLILNASGGAIEEITLPDAPAPSITTVAPPAAR